MLLDPNVRHDVSFPTIVGMGGLGKTTLTQLIYNDERISREFPTRLWVCVSDHGLTSLNNKGLLTSIIESITGKRHHESTVDSLQRQIQQQLAGKKYLLILDDVWNEKINDWLDLEDLLKGGLTGSWVLVTTRSSRTASIVGSWNEKRYSYDLKDLSDEDSWTVFEMLAFDPNERQANPPDLVEIGKNIVKICANVPLAIRVAGSLLYRQAKDKWWSFQHKWTAIALHENHSLSILKFSYDYLESPLKSCFGYCALFPKGYVIYKENLISLWMALGCIMSLNEGQSIEDAGEECFLILLQTCFFQDVEKDEYGQIISCKMHDLMHDLAQLTARKEVCAATCITSNSDKKIRHLSVVESTGLEGSWTKNMVRTLLYLDMKQEGLPVDKLLANMTRLRALGLSNSAIECLPDSIGQLLHLRYLDLSSNNHMKFFPESITKLHNLQTLILAGCGGLIKLPSNLGYLAKLRLLDNKYCELLTHMPAGMDELCCLHKLTMFAVDLSNANWVDQFDSLKALTKLKGYLEIKIHDSEDAAYRKGDSTEGGYLKKKQHIGEIEFRYDGGVSGSLEAFMEDMQPHPNLQRLKLVCYNGRRMPSWGTKDNLVTFLPNLVSLELCRCDGLQYVPIMGWLHHLRFLVIKEMLNLEFIEENRNNKECCPKYGEVLMIDKSSMR